MNLELTSSREQQRDAFFSLQTRQDIATLLEIEDRVLIYYLYIRPPSENYTTFTVQKRSGGVREIAAPISPLKIIQRKLNQVLQSIYEAKPSVYGFVQDRSIRGNAKAHARRRYILNVDLQEFFPSIHFGRVRGMFMSTPYNRNNTVATVLAQICCFNGKLPQGAPTSPIISNMVCARLDAKLQQLAKRHRCTYTRYADDITFSTTRSQFPTTLARVSETGRIEVGEELLQVIVDNRFQVNPGKVRLQTKYRRQEVTGLTVNRFPNVERRYVDQIRGMLHAWTVYGIDSTQNRYLNIFDTKHHNPTVRNRSVVKVLQGKIEFLGMVRGRHNPIYLRLRNRLWDLAPHLAKSSARDSATVTLPNPLIITEGQSDWKHLKAAFLGLRTMGREYPDMEFQENLMPIGDAELVKRCKSLATVRQTRPTIFIADRDVDKTIKTLSDESGDYRDWGNNVYSFVIPVPAHRRESPEISIEFYYTDDDIKRTDKDGRRLFLSNEFHQQTGRHYAEDIVCSDQNKYGRPRPTIVDGRVYDKDNNNVALSKGQFADNILSRATGFTDIDFTPFERILDVVIAIVQSAEAET